MLGTATKILINEIKTKYICADILTSNYTLSFLFSKLISVINNVFIK